MISVELVQFGVTLLVLGFATYTDLKERIVKNWLSFGFIAIGIAFHLGLSIFFNDFNYLMNSLLAVVLAFLVSLLLLKLGVWASGDLKIFMGIAAMNPFNPAWLAGFIGLSSKGIAGAPVFFFEILITSILLFLPVSILIITTRIFSRGLKEKIYSFKKMVFGTSLLAFYFAVVGFHWLNFINDFIMSFVFTVIAIIFFINLKKYDLLLMTLLAIGVAFSNVHEVIQSFVFLFIFLFFGGLVLFFLFEGKELLSKKKKIKELEEGDIIGELIIERNGKVIREKPLSMKTIFNDLKGFNLKAVSNYYHPKGRIIASYFNARGLNQEELKELKKMSKKGILGAEIDVKESLAFLPLTLIAFILLNLTGGLIWFL